MLLDVHIIYFNLCIDNHLYLNHSQRVIEMNNHLSSIKREGDPRSVFVTILQNIQTKIEEIDFISRSRVIF